MPTGPGPVGRRHSSSGSPFEEAVGYARAVRVGDTVHVSGTTGYDYGSMAMPEDVVEQARNAVATIASALADLGAGLEDVVRVRYLLPDPADFEPCWPVLREAFGEARPAATMMVVGLMRPEMRIEIEATAVVGR